MPIIREKYEICDGLFIEKLANKFGVYPIGKTLAISRFHVGQGIRVQR